MGIQGLGKFLSEQAPRCVKQIDIASLMGRVLAVDASMSLYQFMIAIRDSEGHRNLTNEADVVTSHIAGFLARVVKLLENGIKPVISQCCVQIYVFDGKPTELKSGELARRRERKAKHLELLEVAQEEGVKEDIKKYVGRTVVVTKQHNEDIKQLLELLGLPTIQAPSEAEAQCARLVTDGVAYATASEDADALTFGSSVLVRRLTFTDTKSKSKPAVEFTLSRILESLELTMEQFVDFCILCGCDYCDKIKGIGPSTAYRLIKQHRTIETVLKSLDPSQVVPELFPFEEARQFFLHPSVLSAEDIPKIVWKDVDEEKLKKFLVEDNSFSPTRVDAYLNRLRIAKSKSSQTRLELFFRPAQVVIPAPAPKAKAAVKRKSAGASLRKTSSKKAKRE